MQEKELCRDIELAFNNYCCLKDIDKILLFTHSADADGVGCEIVARLFTAFCYHFQNDFFKHYDSEKIEYHETGKLFKERLEVTRMGYKNCIQIIDKKIKEHEGEKCLVLVTDISTTYDLVEYLNGIDNPLIYIDHHLIDDTTYNYLNKWMDEKFDDKFYFLIPNSDSLSPYSSNHYLYDLMCGVNISSFINISSMDKSKLSATYIFWILLLAWFSKVVSNLDGICKAEGIFKVLSDSDTYEWKNHKINRKTGVVYGNKYFHADIPDPFPLIFKYRGYDFLLENLYHIIEALVLYNSNEIATKWLIELMNTVSVYSDIRKKNYGYWSNSMQKVYTDEIGKIGISFAPNADYSMFSAWSFEEDPNLVAIFELYSDSKIISIRVRDNSEFNGAEFMKLHFNGGGHPKAAGGKLTNEGFVQWLVSYWKIKEFNTSEERTDENEFMEIKMSDLGMI